MNENRQRPSYLDFTIALLTLLTIVSCSTASKVNETPISNFEVTPADSEYLKIIDTHTRQAYGYNGFENVFEVRATALTDVVLTAQIQRKAKQFQWDPGQLEKEVEKVAQEGNTRTQFFISFFTPDGNVNDISKTSSLWKVFLDVDGHRYSVSVEKQTGNFTEIQNLYPYHNAFGRPYVGTVYGPRSIIEHKNSKLTITGPVATQELIFDLQ